MNELSRWVVVLGFALATGAHAADDADVARAIQHDLFDEGIRTLSVDVVDGHVTLSGAADNVWEKNRAEEIAREHRDVESVTNDVLVDDQRSDESIASAVASRLRNSEHYSIFDDVNVHVEDGIVTLGGKVTDEYKSEAMARLAARVVGVHEVVVAIDMLSTTSHDRALRQELASRIYNDPIFFRYSSDRVPPVHIIVENGHVRLTGMVDTLVQKRRAESIARQTLGVSTIENDLQVAAQS